MRRSDDTTPTDEFSIELIEHGPPHVLEVNGCLVTLEHGGQLLSFSEFRRVVLDQTGYLLRRFDSHEWDEYLVDLVRRARNRVIDER